MQVVCPKCNRVIDADDINVATDVAQCRACGEIFKVSELVHTDDSGRAVDLNHPPSGAWYEPSFDGFAVGATTRSPIAFFLVPFMCVWSGFSLGGIYGTQIYSGKFNLGTSLFGIPFFLGTLLFGSIALMSVFGKIVVRIRNGEGTVFTGIGPIGWRRRFDWYAVEAVREEFYYTSNNGSGNMNGPGKVITLDLPRRLRFGSGLREFRREFVADVLRQAMKTRGKGMGRVAAVRR